ncbi:MAG TPA: hypothetical protein ENJ95_22915 [Bacteroidetes bacterium]|nr:hypothetical protein [Bacteroidota bacterium]
MKKLLFSLLTFFFATTLVFSQVEPKKALGKAARALSAYKLDPTGNADKLDEAKEMIEIAAASDDIGKQVKTWQTRGEIYNAYSDKDMAKMALANDPNFKPSYPEAPLAAANSFEKALELAKKKYEKKDAISGLTEATKKLNQIGNYQIQTKDYGGAYDSFNKVMEIDKIITANGGEPVIKEEDKANHKYVLAYCAKASGKTEAANGLFKELYEAGTEEPSVYAEYANILIAADDVENGLKVLNEGRAKFPENSEVLFALINYYIKIQDYAKLEKVLQDAIKAEPQNPTVRSAMGNVYMNLFTEEFSKNGDSELATEYFNKSLDYFNQAIELDPKQFDAIYSIGSLYFNKAVEHVKYANELPLDKAKEYEEVMGKATKLMEEALPYFKRAEAINANDNNTLIALSEIYARMNDFEKSKEFKARLETVQGGGKNESSYFSN